MKSGNNYNDSLDERLPVLYTSILLAALCVEYSLGSGVEHVAIVEMSHFLCIYFRHNDSQISEFAWRLHAADFHYLQQFIKFLCDYSWPLIPRYCTNGISFFHVPMEGFRGMYLCANAADAQIHGHRTSLVSIFTLSLICTPRLLFRICKANSDLLLPISPLHFHIVSTMRVGACSKHLFWVKVLLQVHTELFS